MFKHILVFSLKNLWKNKLYSALSILGLATAVMVAVFMLLYVSDMFSWDKHWSNKDSLYRFTSTIHYQEGRDPYKDRSTPAVARTALKSYFDSEIQRITRLYEEHDTTFVVAHREHNYDQILVLADPDIVEMFDFNVLHGDIRDSINDKFKIALSDTLAQNIFGKTDVVGEAISVESNRYSRSYTVGAVYADPNNSTETKTTVWMPVLAQLDDLYLKSINDYHDFWRNYGSNQTFVQLMPDISSDSINKKMLAFMESEIPYDQMRDLGSKNELYSDFFQWELINIGDTHLGPGSWNSIKTTELYLISAVAYIVLMLACVNFVNLTTARSALRSKESALRKVLGANRFHLIVQVLFETCVVVLLSIFVGMLGFEIVSPYVSSFFEGYVSFNYMDVESYIILLYIFIPTVLLSGLYPALLFSVTRPARILQANRSTETVGSAKIRSILVIFQLTVSTVLIAISSAIYLQLEYGVYKGRNVDIENVYHISAPGGSLPKDKVKGFIDEIEKLDSIEKIVVAWSFPFSGSSRTGRFSSVENPLLDNVQTEMFMVGKGYFDLFKTDVIGRLFNETLKSDEIKDYSEIKDGSVINEKIVLNHAAVSKYELGTPEEAVGKYLKSPNVYDRQGNLMDATILYEVIGVVPNAGMVSIREKDPAIIYMYGEKWIREELGSHILFKPSGDIGAVKKDIEAIYKRIHPEGNFPPFIMSITERSRMFINSLIFLSKILFAKMFAVLFIAMIGTIGLTQLAASRRTKEIGMRKVLGASTGQITLMLLRQFTRPVLVASVIAILLASAIIPVYLDGFSYRISYFWIGPICLGACGISLVITWLTVGGIAVNTAKAKPVEALRYE